MKKHKHLLFIASFFSVIILTYLFVFASYFIQPPDADNLKFYVTQESKYSGYIGPLFPLLFCIPFLYFISAIIIKQKNKKCRKWEVV